MTIYVATGNPGKLADFTALTPAGNPQWELLPGFASLPQIEETEPTFAGNARLKAEHYSRFHPGWVLADDSGLEVDALDGAPGIYSARFAGRPGPTAAANDAANNRLLLDRLRGFPPDRRTASFVCVLALARAGQTVADFTGRAPGFILEAACGTGGFGYDPVFFSPEAGCTFAELAPAGKARFSHRGHATRALLEWMRHADFQKIPAP